MDIFCKIIRGEVPSNVVYRDDDVWVVKDIYPQAPVHLLAVPVRHCDSLGDMKEADASLLGKVLLAAHKAAQDAGLGDGYRLIINEGEHGGKEVPHFHVHILGGKNLGAKIVT